MTDWAEVKPGWQVLGKKDGKAWMVDAVHPDGKVTISRARKSFTVPVSGEVTVIATAAELHAAATLAVKVILPGAEELATKGPDNVWRAPNAWRDPGSLLAHTYVMHGRRVEEAPLPDMVVQHREMHADGLTLHVHHIHTPDWYK